MTRLNVVAEGETEEGFIKRILDPYLRRHGVYVTPILIPLKGRARARTHRGGLVSYDPARAFIHRLLTNDSSAYTTTLFDYYGLPDDFPGLADDSCPPPAQLNERVSYLEAAFASSFESPRRFIPYFQLHEFEALLFSDVDILDEALRALTDQNHSYLSPLRDIERHFDTPEDINDAPTTAPSKRLSDLCPRYQKVPFGELIAESIGLETIREACPRFDQWVSTIEALEPLKS